MEERGPDAQRRRRLAAPGVGFIGGLLLVAAIVAAIILVIYWVGGFGEGSEGAFALGR